MRNELMNYTLEFPVAVSQTDKIAALSTTLQHIERVYSYIVYNQYDKNNTLTGHKAVIVLSKNDSHNTLPVDDVIAGVVACTIAPRKNPHKGENVAGYEQPPLEILVEAYKPLIHKLALQQHQYWQKIEVSDLVQMCTCQLIILYRRGYYVHKKLLSTSFNNMVLMSLRGDKYKTSVPLTEATLVVDSYDEDTDAASTHDIDTVYKMNLVRDIVSPATLAQLLYDYEHHCTTPWTMTTVRKIRQALTRKGYTYERIIKELYGE